MSKLIQITKIALLTLVLVDEVRKAIKKNYKQVEIDLKKYNNLTF